MVNTQFCWYCKYNVKDHCVNERALECESQEIDVNPFIDDGVLSEAIEESINLDGIRRLLSEVKIPKTKLNQIMELLEGNKPAFVETIDAHVSQALLNYDFEAQSGIKIVDPCKCVCSYFL